MPDGRKRKPEQRANHRVQVRVTDSTHARILKDAERTGLNKSAICNDIIEEHYGVGKAKRRATRRARTEDSVKRDRLEARIREIMRNDQSTPEPAARAIAEAEGRVANA